MGRQRQLWERVLFVAGASMIACTIAARRLGWGTNGSDAAPDGWLAALFLVGAALLLAALIQRLLSRRRRR